MMRGALLVVMILCAACGDDDANLDGNDDGGNGIDATPDEYDAGEDPLVTRGRYLVNDVAMCSFCHTPRRENGTPDPARFLAGVDCLGGDQVPKDDEMGCVNTRNLTSHETGLANASDEEIKDAFLNGIGTDGRNLLPIMPYWVFHNLTDDDADAIVAYLRTVEPVDHMTPPNQPPFTEPPATLPPIDPDDIPLPSDGFEEEESALRGRYLTSMASVCIDCHTPETEPMSFMFDWDKAFGGGRGFPREFLGYFSEPYPEIIFTSNLTPHETGLDGYSKQDIIKVMKEGLDPDGDGVCAPTHSGPSSPFAGLTDTDVEDIANYLLSLPPVDNAIPEDCEGPPPS
jgi:mono/diheme cytochrome c family protein